MTVRCRANEPHAQSWAQNTVHDEQTEQCDVSADRNTTFWAHDSNNATGWTFFLHRSAQTSSVPTQWLTSGLPTSVTWQEACKWPLTPPSAEIKNEWSYTSTLPYAFMAYTRTNLRLPTNTAFRRLFLSLSSCKTRGGGGGRGLLSLMFQM
jgi:hypothetical protein